MQRTRLFRVSFVFCGVFLSSLFAVAAQSDKAEFTIYNKSDWDFYALYLSPTNKNQWGDGSTQRQCD